jgi:putative transposase
MTRLARIVVPGVPHHVTQRGNRRLDVFFGDDDCQRYLQLVLKYSRHFCLEILAYCLMLNHVHLVCIPSTEKTLEQVFRPVNTRYAQHVNRKYSLSGRLWQGRFFSCPMDVPHAWGAIRYVELNPERAGMVTRAEDYPWSSASAHCGLRQDPLLSPIPQSYGLVIGNWSDWLAERYDTANDDLVRQHTRTGRPV